MSSKGRKCVEKYCKLDWGGGGVVCMCLKVWSEWDANTFLNGFKIGEFVINENVELE